jgi:cyclohexadieny/prephenate dehydrogenase
MPDSLGPALDRPLFDRIALIGIGLIGSSIARAARQLGSRARSSPSDRDEAVLARVAELGLADACFSTNAGGVKGATSSSSACRSGPAARSPRRSARIAEARGAIVSDVGSVKGAVMRGDGAAPAGDVHFIPAHPGRRHRAFRPRRRLRRAVRQPLVHPHAARGRRPDAVERLQAFWRALGSNVEIMDAGAPRPGARHHQPRAAPDRLHHRRHRRDLERGDASRR